jgi:ketosteroid isomerase-like protein
MQTSPGVAAAVLVATLAGCGRSSALSPQDRAALHRLDSAYVQAWLRDDTAAVMATLSPDAVLMPAGVGPLQGDSAIRRFWWPRDGSRTRITAYQSSIDEIDGAPPLAYMRGSGTMSFSYEKDTVRLQQTIRNMTLTVAARQADGTWRVRRRMWGNVSR